MTSVTIYHNPRCSKSRQTLELLKEHNQDPEVILYLESPPDKEELVDIVKKLNVNVRDIVRTGDDAYKELNLSDTATDDELLDAIMSSPNLLQRPIVIAGNDARIGRPPESVLEII